MSDQVPPVDSSFDENSSQSREPRGTQGGYDHLTYDELHHLCRGRGFARKDSKAAPRTRLSAMEATYRKSARDAEALMSFGKNAVALMSFTWHSLGVRE